METKFCQKCGHKLAMSDVFCNYCGAKQHNVNMDVNSNTNNIANDGMKYNNLNNGTAYNNFNNSNQTVQAPYNNMNNGQQNMQVNRHFVGFGEAVQLFCKNAFSFEGCSSRSEFWNSYLFINLISFVLVFMISVLYNPMLETVAGFRLLRIFLVLSSVIGVFLEIGYISVAVRRLHDANLSGGFFWLFFIPFAGWIFMIVFMCQPTKIEGLNRYGRRDNEGWYKKAYAWVILVIFSILTAFVLVAIATSDYHIKYYDNHYLSEVSNSNYKEYANTDSLIDNHNNINNTGI